MRTCVTSYRRATPLHDVFVGSSHDFVQIPGSPFAYWLVKGGGSAADRPELAEFSRWVVEQAAESRAAIGEK